MSFVDDSDALTIALPGVLSWSRPRRERGRVRYPAAYARSRDGWAAVVAHAVARRNWRPPPAARYRVTVTVCGGGRRDLDRVCTAVLDALQAGGAVRDDCLVDALTATRAHPPRGTPPNTVAEVVMRSDDRAPRPSLQRQPSDVEPPSKSEEQEERDAHR